MQQESILSNGTDQKWLDNVWVSIEYMPINVWRKVTETGDLTNLYKTKTSYDERLDNIWLTCWQQYLDEFGVSDEAQRKINLQRKLIKLNSKFVLNNDRSALNLIEMAEKDLEDLSKDSNSKFYEILDIVSTKKGFRIDPNQFTVIEWYHALNNISKNVNDKG